MEKIDWRRLIQPRPGSDGALATILPLVGAAGALGAAFLLGGASTTILFLHGLALTSVWVALSHARKARRATDKLSGEIDSVSTRLLRLESALSDMGREAGPGGLRATVAEVTGEIALLGSLVRDLAMTVATHDRDVAALKRGDTPAAKIPAEPNRPPAEAPAPAPAAGLNVAATPQPAALPEKRPPTPPPEPRLVAPKRESAPVPDGLDARRLAAIVDAFEHDRIDVHLQPILSLPQRKVRAYEALARLRLADEATLVPAEFLPMLKRCGLTAKLDRRVIAKAAAVARHLIAKSSYAFVSCNLSPQALV